MDTDTAGAPASSRASLGIDSALSRTPSLPPAASSSSFKAGSGGSPCSAVVIVNDAGGEVVAVGGAGVHSSCNMACPAWIIMYIMAATQANAELILCTRQIYHKTPGMEETSKASHTSPAHVLILWPMTDKATTRLLTSAACLCQPASGSGRPGLGPSPCPRGTPRAGLLAGGTPSAPQAGTGGRPPHHGTS